MIGLLILFGIALGLLMALLTTMLVWQMVHPPRHTAAWALARGLPCDPNDLNMKFEEWWLDRPGGVRLPVWEINQQKQPKGTDQSAAGVVTAVFIHGWGHARADSLQRLGPFLPLVDRIVLYDLRGHGDATGSASTLGDGEDADLQALLEHLGAGPFVLVGHSMGAVIALRTASKASDSIAGVVAYGPYCDFHRSLCGRLQVNGLPARPLTDFALLVQRLRGITPASLQADDMRRLRMPVLIVHGLEDRVSPLAHARGLAQAAPDATLIEIDDAAHANAHTIDQARHDDAVRAFVLRLCA